MPLILQFSGDWTMKRRYTAPYPLPVRRPCPSPTLSVLASITTANSSRVACREHTRCIQVYVCLAYTQFVLAAATPAEHQYPKYICHESCMQKQKQARKTRHPIGARSSSCIAPKTQKKCYFRVLCLRVGARRTKTLQKSRPQNTKRREIHAQHPSHAHTQTPTEVS